MSEIKKSILEEQIELLEKRISKLLTDYSKANTELKDARQEIILLRKVIEDQNKQLNDFRYNHKMSSIVDYLAGEAGSADQVERQLDDYIREIDQCINFLEKQS